jgi:hypothetical protein
MTADDDRKLLDGARNEALKESFFQHATVANVAALIVWLTVTIAVGEIRLMLWLYVLIFSVIISMTGWTVQRLWLRFRASACERAFGPRAYVERMAGVTIAGGIFGGLVWLFFQRPVVSSAGYAAALSGLAAVVLHVPIWWSEFNRLRKIYLTHL